MWGLSPHKVMMVLFPETLAWTALRSSAPVDGKIVMMSLHCIERMLEKCEASVKAANVVMDASNGDTEGLCNRRRKASIVNTE